MKKVLQLLLITSCIAGIINSAYAEKVPDKYLVKNTEEIKASAALCASGSGFEMLAINNIRARVNTGGDMWHNFATNMAQYYVPAATQKTSLYAGALWIGGVDKNNQLKLAAQRFRQNGIDFFPGPLSIDLTASTNLETCAKWDRMFHMSKAEVSEFIGWYNSENKAEEFPGYIGPGDGIRNWPAHSDDPSQAFYLAPFFDANGDGVYNWEDGDYPYYDFDNVLCPLNYVGIKGWKPAPTMGSADSLSGKPNPYKTEHGGILVDQILKGDETFWWVFNDKGNAHTETGGQPIGLEIRAQAFAFATNDEINNMTFYSYEIINRSTYVLKDTYFAPWTDADLGYAFDDYVGCDVERGMGYCYNGVDTDGTGEVQAYGAHPPAVGVDFFQGPYLDPNGYDNPAYKGVPLENGIPLGGPSFNGDCQIVTWNNLKQTMPFKYKDPITGKVKDSIAEFLVKAEAINGVNFGNGIVDDERYGMRRFVYYNNSSDNVNGEPRKNRPSDYYNYLRGIWLNGQPMRFDGKNATGNTGPITDFMFPGTTDPCNWGTNGEVPPVVNEQWGWTDLTAGNKEDDRRFVQSAGPFTLTPGAVNYITVGIPWARDMTGNAWASVLKLRDADDKCQALFDNCFKVLDGPNAPDIYFVELDQKLILLLRNDGTGSNNKNERYQEVDNTIKGDSLYRFEGYQIYQLASSSVGPDDLTDVTKARLIAQFDIANGIGRLVNFEPDATTGFDMPVLRVDGADKGISHSFEVTTDIFAKGQNRTLVNNKQYYFMAIAYAYNNWKTFDPYNSAEQGQRFPYLAGRTAAGNKKLTPKVAIPHKTVKGITTHSNYGDMPPITRIEGQGNSSNWLELSDKTRAEILSKPPIKRDKDESKDVKFGHPDYPIAYQIEYKPNAGPLTVKVIDPLKVVGKDYLLKFIGNTCTDTYNTMVPSPDYTFAYYINKADWKLFDAETGKEETSDGINLSISKDRDTALQRFYTTNYEQLYPNLGISVTISQTFHPGDYWVRQQGNGFIGFSATFADSSKRWLSGIPDVDLPCNPLNWIRSGTYFEPKDSPTRCGADDYELTAKDTSVRGNMFAWDPKEDYEKTFGRSWAPYTLCAGMGVGSLSPDKRDADDGESLYGPGVEKSFKNMNYMTSIGSVDIVFTPDKKLWTRSIVLEMGPVYGRNEGEVETFCPRAGRSVDKNGNTAKSGDNAPSNDPNHPNYISATGMSWFPGYAINVDTGERLNILFGENSSFSANNGRDMRFNPTNVISDANENYYMGGQHYVYVMGHKTIYNQVPLQEHPSNPQEMPAYDACAKYWELFRFPVTGPSPIKQEVVGGKWARQYIMTSCMYVGMPVPMYGYENMFDYWITGDNEKYKGMDTTNTTFTLKIRVAKPFARYASEIWENPGARKAFSGGTPEQREYKMPIAEGYYENEIKNDNWPMYKFSTKGMEPEIDPEKLKSDVDLISVTPNPYYAYSGYERNALDNRVRFGNLPENCTISIYNIGGTLIRQFIVDNTADSDHGTGNYKGNTLDWDLKNFAGVPIAGGTYLIHVKTPHGEKVIKWFGVIRTLDLTTF